MTGFGSAEGNVLGGRLSIEIRSVNHRYYNPQLKLPFDLGGVEGPLRERLRREFERGHVTVTVRWVETPQRERAVAVDLTRARQLVAAAKELKKRLKLKGDVDLAFVARQPEVLTVQQDGGADGTVQWREVEPIVERAAHELVAMRVREGAALASDLDARLAAIETGAQAIERRAPDRLTAELTRLKNAVAELAGGVQVDEQRLAVEVALLADRVDIAEELVRLRTHVTACREALSTDGAVGKQLGFLAQELLREVNTIGSKANDATITHSVIAMTTSSDGTRTYGRARRRARRPVRRGEDDHRAGVADPPARRVRVLGVGHDPPGAARGARRGGVSLPHPRRIPGATSRWGVPRIDAVRGRAIRHAPERGRARAARR